jgi:hypothetical protein
MLEGNTNFDISLKSRNNEWGIREKNEVIKIAENFNLFLMDCVEMPSNNLCLFFQKK